MGDPVTMALIGAGVGGGSSLLRGKSLGSSLQNAALGGALGYGGGYFGNMFKGAATAADVAAGTAPFEGAVFNASTGTWVNPSYYVGATTPLATYAGGEGLLSNALGNISSSIPSGVKDYMTPSNMIGLASLMQNNQAPLQNVGGGQVRGGQAPQFTPFQTGEVLSPWKKRGQA